MVRAAPGAPPERSAVYLDGQPGAWALRVHVQPGAARTEAAGEHGDCLKLRIAAPPVDGRANGALCTWLAGRLDLPRSAVTVEQGSTGRRKRIRIAADCAAAFIIDRLAG